MIKKKDIRCSECGKIFSDNYSLNQHSKVKHKGKHNNIKKLF